MATYTIPASNKNTLDKRIDLLNAVCDKLHLSRIDYRVTAQDTREIGDTGAYMTWYTVEVSGESPVIGGWRFLAQIEHGDEAGNVIRNLSESELPEAYRDAGANCEHCGMDRNRKVTYILQDETGAYKQVGSSCLHDFTGHDDPCAISDYLQSLNALASDLGAPSDEDMRGNGSHALLLSARFVAYVAATMRTHGWLGRTKAQETGGVSTCERAIEYMIPPSYMRESEIVRPADDDYALAQAAIAWGASQTGASEYEHNLRVVCAGDYCEWRNLGLLASVIVAYRKSNAQDVTGKRTSASEHIGAVGDKVTVDVTVTAIREIDGDYGLTSVVNMLSDDNALVWFASGATVLEAEKSYHLKGTVKKHDTYNGAKQTVLTRCKVL